MSRQTFVIVQLHEGFNVEDIQLTTIPGANALIELERLRGLSSSSGLYPILLGDAEDKSRIFEAMEDGPDPVETLRYSQTIDPVQWLQKQRELEPHFDEMPEGDWPKHAGKMAIITHLDVLTRKPKREVFIALMKLNAPWEAFAYLRWGNWNACPEPAVHCALHRYWASRYGAEVISITGDIVQCVVARPPADRPASLQLAREQYIYCNDIVDQGTETIAALAASVMDCNYWYFWWD